jgi:hypothetical protein
MPDDIYTDNEDYGTFPPVQQDPLSPPVRVRDIITAVAVVVVLGSCVVGVLK